MTTNYDKFHGGFLIMAWIFVSPWCTSNFAWKVEDCLTPGFLLHCLGVSLVCVSNPYTGEV